MVTIPRVGLRHPTYRPQRILGGSLESALNPEMEHGPDSLTFGMTLGCFFQVNLFRKALEGLKPKKNF